MIPPEVTAEAVKLRPWRPEEAGLYVSSRDETVFSFTTEAPQLDEAECRSNIEAARADPWQAPFAICGPDDRPVGNVAVVQRGDVAVLSYWLAPQARGRGWAVAAVRAATRWAFDTWEVSVVELEIDPANQPSVRVAEASGFRRHGIRLESACGGAALVFRLPRSSCPAG